MEDVRKYLPPEVEDEDIVEKEIRNMAIMYYDEDVCDIVKQSVVEIVKVMLDKLCVVDDEVMKDKVFRTMLFMVSKQVIRTLYLRESIEQTISGNDYEGLN